MHDETGVKKTIKTRNKLTATTDVEDKK